MPFDGLRVVSLESRRAREMEMLIARHGGVPFIAPSVEERGKHDDGTALRFVEQLEAGAYDMVICTTATGLSFLKDVVSKEVPLDRLSNALRNVAIVARGPKPLSVLRPMGVPVAVTVPEPNTWKEILPAVESRSERRIAVLEYGRPNVEMNAALAQMGATVTPVALYRWTLPEDVTPLQEAVRRIATRQCDVVLFTSSIQLDHLLEIARDLNLEGAVLDALAHDLAVASVGPIMTATLEAHGITPGIVPQHPKMWAIVKAAAEESHQVLTRPRV